MFHSNHGPISHCFWETVISIKKTQNFPTPCIFAPPLMGFPLELGIGTGGQKLERWGYRAEKEVWRYLQSSGWKARTWRQTDGQSDTRWQQRPSNIAQFRLASFWRRKTCTRNLTPLTRSHCTSLWFKKVVVCIILQAWSRACRRKHYS